MKPFERRKIGAYPYYSLSEWSGIYSSFVSGRKTYKTRQEAQKAAMKKGLYRIIKVTERGRENLNIFEVK